jgi:hypothetical protein
MSVLTRTFAPRAVVISQPDSAIHSFLVKPEDTIRQIQDGWDPSDSPVRYATLFPIVFKPNALPASYQLSHTMGLGSG